MHAKIKKSAYVVTLFLDRYLWDHSLTGRPFVWPSTASRRQNPNSLDCAYSPAGDPTTLKSPNGDSRRMHPEQLCKPLHGHPAGIAGAMGENDLPAQPVLAHDEYTDAHDTGLPLLIAAIEETDSLHKEGLASPSKVLNAHDGHSKYLYPHGL